MARRGSVRSAHRAAGFPRLRVAPNAFVCNQPNRPCGFAVASTRQDLPSIAPEQLHQAMLLQVSSDVRSAWQPMECLEFDLLPR